MVHRVVQEVEPRFICVCCREKRGYCNDRSCRRRRSTVHRWRYHRHCSAGALL